MTDWNDLVQSGKDAIAENKYSFDFDVVASGSTDTKEVERRVKKHFGKNASVTSTDNSVYISIKDSRGWSYIDEDAMDSMCRDGLLSWFKRWLR